MIPRAQIIKVQETEITVVKIFNQDYLSLTDMCKNLGDDRAIHSWIRNKNTIEFLGLWEQINNDNFKPHEFVGFKNQAGLNRFNPSPKQWIDKTNAIGLKVKAGKTGGGTYAHKDIAFKFGAWLSPEFELYLIKEFQRLKEDEAKRLDQTWDIERYLAKVNYRIHTDAIKEKLIPPLIDTKQHGLVYAEEADILNQAVFGITAADWRKQNPLLNGNMRDHAYLEQLIVLRNIESISAVLILEGFSPLDRLIKLNDYAIKQMKSLLQTKQISQGKNKNANSISN